MDNWVPKSFPPDVEGLYANEHLRRTRVLFWIACLIGAMAFAGFAAWDPLLAPDALYQTVPYRIAAALHFGFVGLLMLIPAIQRSIRLTTLLFVWTYAGVAVCFGLILAQLPGGFVAGLSGFILGMIFLPALANGVLHATLIVLPYYLLALMTISVTGATRFELINTSAWLGGSVGFAIGFAHLLDIINRRAFDLQRKLAEEKQHSDALLLNILPFEVAERLKANEEPLADAHDSVSVLFADLAGFTDLARTMTPVALVELLNDLFSRFDGLAAKHDAEKIKTIGDSYMLATGLRGSVADHAERISDLALDMQRSFRAFCTEFGLDLKLRIGVHSEAVVAGVIGKQKFSYDLWGDTVNIASRMESEGLPDAIQISEETYRLLSDGFHATPRGEIAIKGHRARKSYLLNGKH